MTRLTSPSVDAVTAALDSALDSANTGARTRTVSRSDVASWPERVASSPEGVLAADGGSVPNCYKYAAETTDVVVAWWTDGRGRKTVTVSAARVRARSTSGGRGNGTATPRGSAWELTFPSRASQLAERRRERLARLLEEVGPEGDDDRLAIRSAYDRHLAAACDGGLLVSDHATRPRVVQVVVRDSTTGRRHHITVPPKFATPSSKTYQKLGSSAARVKAAVAWTFSLAPSEYAPTCEA